jgi:hypothetical protein
MRNLVFAGLFALGLAAVAQPAFACASPDQPQQPAQVQRNPGSEQDCAVFGNPKATRIKLDQMLKSQASRDHQIALMGQRRYLVVAACEDACSEMGLDVVDVTTGKSLGKVEGGTEQPQIEIDVPESAEIRAIARMDNCSIETGCRYGVGVYTIGALNKPKTKG